jgi:2-amino-4-hydroxy-6-hydroxymethyldihydropteridine diphosphokinase
LTVFIGVGSNIAPEENIPAALERLARSPGISVTGVSRFYRCSPVGGEVGDTEFLNGVFSLETRLEPRPLKFDVLRDLEATLGRSPHGRAGPRTLDLDIVAYGNSVLEEPDLRVPDPDWLLRPFVAVPMAELAPGFVHPVTGQSAAEIALEVGRAGLRLDVAMSERLGSRISNQR